MLFHENLTASGNLFRVSDNLLIGNNKLWIGSIELDGKAIIVASAVPRYRLDPLDQCTLEGFRLTLGTTDPGDKGLGYYAEVSPAGIFPGDEMTGFLKHSESRLDDILHVRVTYSTNADGTSRLDVSIDSIIEQLESERLERVKNEAVYEVAQGAYGLLDQ